MTNFKTTATELTTFLQGRLAETSSEALASSKRITFLTNISKSLQTFITSSELVLIDLAKALPSITQRVSHIGWDVYANQHIVIKQNQDLLDATIIEIAEEKENLAEIFDFCTKITARIRLIAYRVEQRKPVAKTYTSQKYAVMNEVILVEQIAPEPVDLWYIHPDTPTTVREIEMGTRKPSRRSKERLMKQIENLWIHRVPAYCPDPEFAPYNLSVVMVDSRFDGDRNENATDVIIPMWGNDICYSLDGVLSKKNSYNEFYPFLRGPSVWRLAGEVNMTRTEPCTLPIVERKPFTATKQMKPPTTNEDSFSLQGMPSAVADMILNMVTGGIDENKDRIIKKKAMKEINEMQQITEDMPVIGNNNRTGTQMTFRDFNIRAWRYETEDNRARVEYNGLVNGNPTINVQPTRIGRDGELYNVTGRVARTDNGRLFTMFN